MIKRIARNQVWVDFRYGLAGVSFYLRDMARVMFNAEYDHDIRSFVVRGSLLGVTLFVDVYLKPDLMADLPEVDSI